MKLIYRASLLAVAVLLGWAVVWHTWGLLFGLGVHPYPAGTPWTYQLWSGFVPALTVMSLLGSLGAAWHLHNCHKEGCWRLGKHRIGGTPWCTRHMDQAVPERTELAMMASIEATLLAVAEQIGCKL